MSTKTALSRNLNLSTEIAIHFPSTVILYAESVRTE